VANDSTPSGEASAIATKNLSLTYGQTQVLRGIDLELNSGQTLALLGPSGCGKTTLLRLVAGLLAPTAGDIFIGGRQVAGKTVLVPPEKRGLGMVFQDYALWPHLTVAGNVAFPLEMAGIGRAARERRVTVALDRVGLATMAERSPSALSGGQQQRVAIARAIVGEPRIVLFDEPLSNLDRELRETMVAELGALIRDLGLTAIYVTHDQSEALTLADQVAVMDAGDIAQLAAPEDLVEHPASPKVAEFLRLGAVLSLRRADDRWLFGHCPLELLGGPQADAAQLLITPRALVMADAGSAALIGEVIAVHYRDTAYAVTVRLADTAPAQTVQIASNTRMRIGERVGLEIISDRLRWFPATTKVPLKKEKPC
jgi:iron(III) transport system ATP-binding protein